MSTILRDSIYRLKDGQSLSRTTMADTMRHIMNGEVDEEELTDFLTALAAKGENVDELTGAAQVLREKALSLHAPYDAVDCCGTGGDQTGTYNISTAVALVAAACGVPIAKHGNRSASSKSGAADVLEELGVNLKMPAQTLEKALEQFNFAFLMAPNHHKSMKHVATVRKTIGRRTIFNLLGPLANPAGTRYQLIGVFDKDWVRPMAETLKQLGTKRAWIVHGSDGMDEITVTGPTFVARLDEDGTITEDTLSPDMFGLNVHPIEALRGGDATVNAKALRAVLEGQKGAYRDIVLANTAAVLIIHGSATDLKDAVQTAKTAIDSGDAWQLLCDYIDFTRSQENLRSIHERYSH